MAQGSRRPLKGGHSHFVPFSQRSVSVPLSEPRADAALRRMFPQDLERQWPGFLRGFGIPRRLPGRCLLTQEAVSCALEDVRLVRDLLPGEFRLRRVNRRVDAIVVAAIKAE